MNIAIGCDEAACDLKNAVKQHLLAQGHEVTDFGTHNNEPVLYPDIGIAVGEAIVQGRHERGVLGAISVEPAITSPQRRSNAPIIEASPSGTVLFASEPIITSAKV